MDKDLPVYAVSLGCPKNRVDTERMLGSLSQNIRLVPNAGRAKLIFLNTCAFIEPAARESIRSIIDLANRTASLKKRPVLAVAGCLPGRYGISELQKEFPEVDVWLVPENLSAWPRMLDQKLGLLPAAKPGRLHSTAPSFAWLKIAEGCNHKCAFCAIPSIRGSLRSEKADMLLAEAEELLKKGILELDLVAQDVLAWGNDFKDADLSLIDLLKLLKDLPGLRWLRLLYLYPGSITGKLLEELANIGKPLLPYLDLPFQHSEMDILRRMGRPFRVEAHKKIRLIRDILPEAALRATFIVGFPGETEDQFARLCDFVAETRFHNVGVFTFYAEEGTAAAKFPNQVPDEIKKARRNRLMEIQAQISREILAEYRGKTMDILVDADKSDEWPGLHAGRVWFQAPEVDGLTYVSGPGVKPGVMLPCEIVDSQTYDLSAMA